MHFVVWYLIRWRAIKDYMKRSPSTSCLCTTLRCPSNIQVHTFVDTRNEQTSIPKKHAFLKIPAWDPEWSSVIENTAHFRDSANISKAFHFSNNFYSSLVEKNAEDCHKWGTLCLRRQICHGDTWRGSSLMHILCGRRMALPHNFEGSSDARAESASTQVTK